MRNFVTRPDLLTTPCIDHGQKGSLAGYGYKRLPSGKRVQLHRWVYMQKYCITNLPSWAFIMHICDNPRCVNLEHLQLGNVKLNNLDKAQKGRIKPMPGENHGRSKLTETQVREIYTKYAGGGYTQMCLGEMYGVSRALVQRILNGKIWKHLNLRVSLNPPLINYQVSHQVPTADMIAKDKFIQELEKIEEGL